MQGATQAGAEAGGRVCHACQPWPLPRALDTYVSATCEPPQHAALRTRAASPGRTARAEVAGDFYLIIIMVILMIIIILHHGPDDYNHMGMQWALQLGLHDGGY